MAPRPELSLVFPVFDEQENVGPLLASAVALGRRLGRSFEIIVVDDGSRDESALRIAAACALHPEITSLHHASNRGYGAALRTGLRAARGAFVFFSDADLQFDLGELSDLLAHTESFDVVAGVRTPRRDPWARRLLAWGWGTLVNALFDLSVRDIDCAFKLFRREVLDAIPIASLGAFVNTEILVRARAAGFRIRQVPVTHHPRRAGRAKGANPRVIVRALVELITLYGELRAASRSAADERNGALPARPSAP
jgi:glycosyltransferase involved in cell wall biosynthesis